MTNEEQVIDAERAYRTALLKPDEAALETFLTEDWILTDVTGMVVGRPGLLASIRSGDLTFEALDMDDTSVRIFGETAIVTGRTAMKATYKGAAFAGSTRYTHVYVRQDGRWRMAAAQGTIIAS